MMGYVYRLVACFMLVCVTTLFGDNQNQHKTRLEELVYQPSTHSYVPLVREPGFISDQYENRNFPTPRYSKDSQYNINSDHQHNHNHDHHHHQHDVPEHGNPYLDSSRHKQRSGFGFSMPESMGLPSLNRGNRGTTEVSDVAGLFASATAARNNTKRKSEDYDSTKMLYPTEGESPNIKPLDPNSPRRNCTFNLCDKVEGYPAEKIKNIISRSKELKQYFHNLNKDFVDIKSRFGEDGETLCSTTVYTKFPETATNTAKVERYLVNVGEYKQGIIYEKCESHGRSCKFAEIFPDGHTATCKQKFTVRRLMSVTKESEEPMFDNFELPSCCVCVIKKN